MTPSNTALLIMDFQNDFCDPDGLYGMSGTFSHVPKAAAGVIPTVLPVLRACKSKGIPIVATSLRVLDGLDGKAIGLDQFRPQLQSLFETKGFRTGTWGQSIVDEFLAPDVAPDYVIDKWGHSAMYLTGLEKVLRALQVENLVLAGLGTNGVVEGTARDAVARGWKITTLMDCVAAPQQELHEAALLNLGHLGAISTSDEFLASLGAA